MAAMNSVPLLRWSFGSRVIGCVKASNATIPRIPLNFRRTMCSIRATNDDEEAAARAAAPNADTGAPTIFDKIIAKEIPSNIVYEDEKVLAFRDISPQAPTHVLIIPKSRDGLTQLSKAEERHKEILGHLLYAAKIVAEKEGIDDFRVVINSGPTALITILANQLIASETKDIFEHLQLVDFI